MAESYRPSQKKMDDMICMGELDAVDIGPYTYNNAAPAPSGMEISAVGDRIALTTKDDWAVQYRRIYGYIGLK